MYAAPRLAARAPSEERPTVIVLSLVLVIVAAVTLGIGFFQQANLTFVYVSIASALAAGLFLVLGIIRGRPRRKPVRAAGAQDAAAAWSPSGAWPGADDAAIPREVDQESPRGDAAEAPTAALGASGADPGPSAAATPAAGAGPQHEGAGEGPSPWQPPPGGAEAPASSPAPTPQDGGGGPDAPSRGWAPPAAPAPAPQPAPQRAAPPVAPPPPAWAPPGSTPSRGAPAPPPSPPTSSPPARAWAPPPPPPAGRGSSATQVVSGEDLASARGADADREAKRFERALSPVPGVGPAKRQQLLSHFGTLRRLKAARVDQIAAVPGISSTLAQRIHDALR